jgi:hypothetical protein
MQLAAAAARSIVSAPGSRYDQWTILEFISRPAGAQAPLAFALVAALPAGCSNGGNTTRLAGALPRRANFGAS